MTGKEDVYRGPAIRALCRITDVSAVSFCCLSCPVYTISTLTLSSHARKTTSCIYYLILIIKKVRHRLLIFFPLSFPQTTMLQAIERYMKQAIVDKVPSVSSSALVSSLVRKWHSFIFHL